MEPAPAEPGKPRLISRQLTSEDVQAQSDEIAEAVHEYVTVYRDPAKFLVMHPEDYARLSPHFQNERGQPSGHDPLIYRVHAGLDHGAVLLSDTDDPEWEAPPAQPS